MEKRMLIAIVASIAILIGSQYYFMQSMPPAPVNDNQSVQKEASNTAKKTVSEETANTEGKAVVPATAPITVQTPEMTAVEKEIKVTNNLYTIVLTSKGGTVKRIELQEYKDKNGKSLVLKGDEVLPPLSMGTDEAFKLSGINFSVRGRDITLGPSMNTGAVIFEYSAEGRSIRRTYTFHENSYGFDLKDETQGLKSYWITLGKDFGILEKDSSVHFGPVVLKDTDRMEFTGDKLKEPKNFKDGVKWIAQEDKYFFSAIVPKGKIEDSKVWGLNNDGLVALRLADGVNEYFVYAGPKNLDQLEKLKMGLEHIVDFGFFSIISRPLFWVLKQFYTLTHNYGIAIIILTILVRIPFIPLINKGQQSMKKLQDIQPKMAEVKEKFKNDPQRMQKETMELYKKHKVNPFGGCLPMLLQIPVFFALYKVLLIAIELRSAPFALWITDLSIKDPYYVMPIVMGITMVIQQKMTPSTADPMQQKIMMLMPVVFTFMFLTFPSGLVLYWLVNNVLSIIQQFYVNKKAAQQPA